MISSRLWILLQKTTLLLFCCGQIFHMAVFLRFYVPVSPQQPFHPSQIPQFSARHFDGWWITEHSPIPGISGIIIP